VNLQDSSERKSSRSHHARRLGHLGGSAGELGRRGSGSGREGTVGNGGGDDCSSADKAGSSSDGGRGGSSSLDGWGGRAGWGRLGAGVDCSGAGGDRWGAGGGRSGGSRGGGTARDAEGEGNTGLSASSLNSSDDLSLVASRAGRLDARSDLGDQVGLLAMASEVSKTGAAISGQDGDEAAESTGRDVVQLSGGNRGQGKGNGSKRGLHFDSIHGV